MSSENTGNAVKLYVFVDNLNYTSDCPLTVIVSKFKTIADLKKEFAENQSYIYEEQHWVINNIHCYDEFEINEIVKHMTPYKKGFFAFLFIMSDEDCKHLTEYVGTFLESRYRKLNPEIRWKESNKCPIIIADIVDTTKPMPKIGWNCDSCTLFNKPFLKYCDVCGCSRPDNFQMPKHFIFTKEDQQRIKRDKEIEAQAKKKEEATVIRLEEEKIKNLEKLKNMYKEQVAFTTEVIECPTCLGEYQPGEAIVLHNCLHTICKDCFREYLTNINDPQVKCFNENCIGHVEDQEISGVLTQEEYERYQQLSLRTAESITQNTFHCQSPNCTAWVVYDDNVNFFPCPLCKHNNCILCRAIHEEKTCKEYQDEMAINARNDEAAKKDLAFLQNLIDTGQAMKCPGCKIIIQKKSGCDWMQCNMCKTEICWATKGPRWGPKGKGDTSGGCKCRVNNKKCVPTCGNCH